MPEPSPPTLPRRTLLTWAAMLPLASLASPEHSRPDVLFQRVDLIAEGLIPGAASTSPGLQLQQRLSTGWLGVDLNALTSITAHFAHLTPSTPSDITPNALNEVVAELDRACFTEELGTEAKQQWATVKMAVLSIYFASQQGAAQHLRYAAVPGRWLPDIPQQQATPYLSNDWLAMWFS